MKADGCFPVGCFVLQEHCAIPEAIAILGDFVVHTHRLRGAGDPLVKLAKNSHEPMGRTAQTEVVILKMWGTNICCSIKNIPQFVYKPLVYCNKRIAKEKINRIF